MFDSFQACGFGEEAYSSVKVNGKLARSLPQRRKGAKIRACKGFVL
jgi:hypothetical protein